MSKQVKTFDQLKDSKLLYEKTQEIYMIKSSAIIQSTNKNYIMFPFAGKIADINISEDINAEKGRVFNVFFNRNSHNHFSYFKLTYHDIRIKKTTQYLVT